MREKGRTSGILSFVSTQHFKCYPRKFTYVFEREDENSERGCRWNICILIHPANKSSAAWRTTAAAGPFTEARTHTHTHTQTRTHTHTHTLPHGCLRCLISGCGMYVCACLTDCPCSRPSACTLTSELLTRPSWKEQSPASCVHMWRYLHQWQGKFPLTQDRHLERVRAAKGIVTNNSMLFLFLHFPLSFCLCSVSCVTAREVSPLETLTSNYFKCPTTNCLIFKPKVLIFCIYIYISGYKWNRNNLVSPVGSFSIRMYGALMLNAFTWEQIQHVMWTFRTQKTILVEKSKTPLERRLDDRIGKLLFTNVSIYIYCI